MTKIVLLVCMAWCSSYASQSDEQVFMAQTVKDWLEIVGQPESAAKIAPSSDEKTVCADFEKLQLAVSKQKMSRRELVIAWFKNVLVTDEPWVGQSKSGK